MPKNKIEDLRNLLFDTMERLLDPDDTSMDIQRAKAIGDVGQVIINTAKVEVDFMKQTGFGGSGFIQNTAPAKQLRSFNTLPQELPEPVDTSEMTAEELCLNCTLPECNETSPHCLVQIQRKAA